MSDPATPAAAKRRLRQKDGGWILTTGVPVGMLAPSLTPGRFDSRAWFRRRQFKIPDRWLATAGGMCCCFAVLRQGVLRLPESFPQQSGSLIRRQTTAEGTRGVLAVLGGRPEAEDVFGPWFQSGQPGVMAVGAGQGGKQPAGHLAIEDDAAAGGKGGRLDGKRKQHLIAVVRGEDQTGGLAFGLGCEGEFLVRTSGCECDRRRLNPAVVTGVEPVEGCGRGMGGDGRRQPHGGAAVEGKRVGGGESGKDGRQVFGFEPDVAARLYCTHGMGEFVDDGERDAGRGCGQVALAQFGFGVGADALDAGEEGVEHAARPRVIAVEAADDAAEDAIGGVDGISRVELRLQAGDGDEAAFLQPLRRFAAVGLIAVEVDDVGAGREEVELVIPGFAADVHKHGQVAVLDGAAHAGNVLGGEGAFVTQADAHLIRAFVEPVAFAVRGGAKKDVVDLALAQAAGEEVGEDGFAVVGGGGQEDGGEEVGHGSVQRQSGGAKWRAR